jgi:hypothetical protein
MTIHEKILKLAQDRDECVAYGDHESADLIQKEIDLLKG